MAVDVHVEGVAYDLTLVITGDQRDVSFVQDVDHREENAFQLASLLLFVHFSQQILLTFEHHRHVARLARSNSPFLLVERVDFVVEQENVSGGEATQVTFGVEHAIRVGLDIVESSNGREVVHHLPVIIRGRRRTIRR